MLIRLCLIVISVWLSSFITNEITSETVLISKSKNMLMLTKAGRKYELAIKKPLVGFEIDGVFKVLEADSACDYSAKFQSVVGTGSLILVDDRI